jgi:hypothetical protein
LTDGTPNRAPVLLLAFNRPDLLERVIAGIRGTGERAVFASIDGPRPDHPEDRKRCAAVRRIVEGIDWATELRLKAEETNLGCGRAVSEAITWALGQVPEIIVLEDDCLADPSFLRFCDEMLDRYRADRRVMHVAGTNWGADRARYGDDSYAFTSFAPIWGWATWRRAWELNDHELQSWRRMRLSGTSMEVPLSRRFRRLLEREWDLVLAGHGTWDHQWQYSVIRHGGLSISPAANMVVNLGFRADATQLATEDRIFSSLPLEAMSFPLRHPRGMTRNESVEAVFERIYWQKLGWHRHLYRALTPKLRSVARRLAPRPS